MLMPVKSPDFHYVAPEHKAIDARLENWASYVRVKFPSWVSPIWKMGKSNGRQWHVPEYRPACDTLDGHVIEKAVADLPKKHCAAVRWAYVFRDHPRRVSQQLGVTREELQRLIHDGRQMLINRRV